jgi:hypothetical protein
MKYIALNLLFLVTPSFGRAEEFEYDKAVKIVQAGAADQKNISAYSRDRPHPVTTIDDPSSLSRIYTGVIQIAPSGKIELTTIDKRTFALQNGPVTLVLNQPYEALGGLLHGGGNVYIKQSKQTASFSFSNPVQSWFSGLETTDPVQGYVLKGETVETPLKPVNREGMRSCSHQGLCNGVGPTSTLGWGFGLALRPNCGGVVPVELKVTTIIVAPVLGIFSRQTNQEVATIRFEPTVESREEILRTLGKCE